MSKSLTLQEAIPRQNSVKQFYINFTPFYAIDRTKNPNIKHKQNAR